MVDRIWDIYEDGAFTPEEVHARLEAEAGGRVILNSVRARICGLHKAGRLVDSGERGLAESGRSKAVKWRRATPAEYAEHVARKAAAEAGE